MNIIKSLKKCSPILNSFFTTFYFKLTPTQNLGFIFHNQKIEGEMLEKTT